MRGATVFIVFLYDQDEYKKFLGVCSTLEIAEQVIEDDMERYEGTRDKNEYLISETDLIERME